MKTLRKHKINFSMTAKNDLDIFRNGKKELSIKGPSKELVDHLSIVLKTERDYESFLEFFGLDQNTHLVSWLFNYVSYMDRDRLDEFRKIVVIPR